MKSKQSSKVSPSNTAEVIKLLMNQCLNELVEWMIQLITCHHLVKFTERSNNTMTLCYKAENDLYFIYGKNGKHGKKKKKKRTYYHDTKWCIFFFYETHVVLQNWRKYKQVSDEVIIFMKICWCQKMLSELSWPH